MRYFRWPTGGLIVFVWACFVCYATTAATAPRNAVRTPIEAAEQQNGAKAGDRLVSVDFDNVDLTVFIKFISEITGTNFVVDENVRDKVTIISPTKISVDKAYRVFESVLEVYGYTMVKSGDVTKVVKTVDARTKSIETRIVDGPATIDDKVVTQIIPLSYADAEEVKRLFTPFIAKDGIILSYDSTNMLIITDVSSNIRRLQRILSVIDVPGHGKQLSVIALDYADASKLVPILESVFQDAATKREKGATERMKMVADERANAIILVASEVETQRIKELIAMLDRKVPQGKEKIHVYYLKNAEAEELVTVLQTFPGKKGESKGTSGAPVISADVSIAADAATNSLIIMADRNDYVILKDIIEKLDIPRSMVFIECLIAEVNVDKSLDLGVEWMAGEEAHHGDTEGVVGGGFGGAGYTNLSSAIAGAATTGTLSLPPGFSIGAFGEAVQIGDVSLPSIGAMIQALQKDKDVHILSTPQIMTTDNEEASIIVGKNIPYLTKIGTTSTTETYSNYEYKDVGISLTIKPQINENRLIRLALTQEVTRLDVGSTFSAERPSTLKRTIKTNVIVHDGHTIVIGGLIDDSLSQVEYRTPCLGSIPLLGWLFKSISDSDVKTNLFIFLTPHVIKTAGEAATIFEDKRESIEGVIGGSIKMYPDVSSANDDSAAVESFTETAVIAPEDPEESGNVEDTAEKNGSAGETTTPVADEAQEIVADSEEEGLSAMSEEGHSVESADQNIGDAGMDDETVTDIGDGYTEIVEEQSSSETPGETTVEPSDVSMTTETAGSEEAVVTDEP